MYTFDHDLFSALNFDGGTAMDRVMLTVSGTAMWLPVAICMNFMKMCWTVRIST